MPQRMHIFLNHTKHKPNKKKIKMASSSSNSSHNKNVNLHFVLFPLMLQGHTIPMLDIAKLLIHQSIILSITIHITIFTTPQSASLLQIITSHYPQIHIVLLHPSLPISHKNLDQLISLNQSLSFFSSLAHDFHSQALSLCQSLSPNPSCIISDICLPWTLQIASHIGVPWISFSGASCFANVVMTNIMATSGSGSGSGSGNIEVFGMEFNKAQLPIHGVLSDGMMEFFKQIGEAEKKGYGMIVNSFEELEGSYVTHLKKKVRGNRVWCVGPVSSCNEHYVDKAQRGKGTTEKGQDDDNNNDKVMKWLDLQDTNSVLYVCLGSLHNLKTPQLIELGLGLEASKRPFMWVVRASNKLQKWIQQHKFEQRIKPKGLIIRDWAPQLLILSHKAIGGFLTHCGWNSCLEAISYGLPMLTWPLFSDQFLNEKLVADVLNIAVKIGAKNAVMKMKEEDEEEIIIEVKKEDVKEGIERVMGKGNENEERRKKAREFGEMAKKAWEEGGSSQLNIRLLIDDIMNETKIST